MFNQRSLIILQLSCFILITIAAFVFSFYFPDLPPFVRAMLPSGSIGIIHLSNTDKPNARFLEWFNRDPERNIPTDTNIIVAPADGFVQFINNINGITHIVIEMRYTDVHVQRVPLDGVVVRIEGEGKKLAADANIGDYALDKMMPFQKITTIQSEIGTVKVRQITSLFANRIQVFIKEGENVKRGQRLGRVLAGSTVVLEVPEKVKIMVHKNQETTAGETILAKY